MVTKTAILALSVAVLSGCATPYSPVPLATNFPTTKQEKLQAAAHWGVIATHIEKQVMTELRKTSARPVYVASPNNPTPFQQALTNQLISSLVKDGHVVSRSPAGALQLGLDVQAVTFTPTRAQALPVGAATALATGVWVLSEHNPISSSVSKIGRFARTVGIGAAIDAYKWYDSENASGSTPRTELIITASISDQYRYYARASNTYYVADGDRALYGVVEEVPKEHETTLFKVKGDK
ncbi:hypothetical protein ABT364_04555 [Massilia sp. SR12]